MSHYIPVSSVQIFPIMILLTVWQENMFSCSFVVSQSYANLEFSEDGRKVPRNWDFSPFIKEQWMGKKEIPNSKYDLYDRFEFPTLESLHALLACICTLAVVDDPFNGKLS